MDISSGDSLSFVPVVDVHKDNLDALWPSITDDVRSASFIAVDVELSGLGNRAELMTKIIEDRYKVVARVARSRAILSLGLSCFRQHSEPAESVVDEENPSQPPTRNQLCSYEVRTYNITLLCTEDYTVEPSSLQFLVQHGFDFNKQYAQGAPYCRGNDRSNVRAEVKSKSVVKPKAESVRNLFSLIIKSKKSLVIHNGFVDVIFLYHHLYLEAPKNLNTFLVDLFEMFEGGIFDTKYIAEYKLRYPATYLEYVFRKMQWEMDERKSASRARLSLSFPEFEEASLPYVERRDLSLRKCNRPERTKADICDKFANHGWCSKGSGCLLLHDVCTIIGIQKATSKRNRPKKRKMDDKRLASGSSSPKLINICPTEADSSPTVAPETSADDPDTTCGDSDAPNSRADENDDELVRPDDDNSATLIKSSTHRAGYDAFMTGYMFAGYLATLATPSSSDSNEPLQFSEGVKRQSIMNRVYLSGKDHPLSIQKSAYASSSKTHDTKIKSINSVSDKHRAAQSMSD